MSSGPILMAAEAGAFRALGDGGEPVWRRAAQLRAAIDTRLGKRHADLFAIPHDQAGRIEWQAAFEGTPRAWATLSEPERQALRAKVQELRPDLERLVERLDAAGRSDGERAFGRLLRHALVTPGIETLYSVDARPVLAFWGFSPEDSEGSILGVAAVPAAAPPAWSATATAAPTQVAPVQPGWNPSSPTPVPAAVAPPTPAAPPPGTPGGWAPLPGSPPATTPPPTPAAATPGGWATQTGAPPQTAPGAPPGGTATPGGWASPAGPPPPQGGPPGGMPPPAPPPAAVVPPAGSGWWKGALLALFLLVALGATAYFVRPYLPLWVWDGNVTLPPVAGGGPGPGAAPVDDSALRAERAREAALRADVVRLWAQFNDKRNQCRPGQPIEQGQNPPPPTNEEITRRGGRIGRMNVVLSWQGNDDLDLHVVCPSGQVINYLQNQHCGGTLDVDANHTDTITNPAENVVWDNAPAGRYKIMVGRYEDRDPRSPATPFTVELRIDGKVVRSASGAASDKLEEVFSFDVPVPGTPAPEPPRKP